MTDITFPTTKTTKDAIRDAIGQSVVFVVRDVETPCPTCSGLDLLDHSNQTSLDPFCATCSGAYWIYNTINLPVIAHVRWVTIVSESRFGGGDEPDFGIAGELITGTCTITIDIDDITEEQIDKIKYVIADNRKLEILRHGYRGVPTRDRIRFTCREYSKNE